MKTDFEKVKEACYELQKSTLAKRLTENDDHSNRELVDNWTKIAFEFIMSDFEKLKEYAEKIINNSEEDRPKLRASINELLLDFVSQNFKLIMTTNN